MIDTADQSQQQINPAADWNQSQAWNQSAYDPAQLGYDPAQAGLNPANAGQPQYWYPEGAGGGGAGGGLVSAADQGASYAQYLQPGGCF